MDEQAEDGSSHLLLAHRHVLRPIRSLCHAASSLSEGQLAWTVGPRARPAGDGLAEPERGYLEPGRLARFGFLSGGGLRSLGTGKPATRSSNLTPKASAMMTRVISRGSASPPSILPTCVRCRSASSWRSACDISRSSRRRRTFAENASRYAFRSAMYSAIVLSAIARGTLTAGSQRSDRQNAGRHYVGSILSATLLRQWDLPAGRARLDKDVEKALDGSR